ncbi:MAG: hypothetical protein JWN86_394 [Planctomycetota bacterium]|nr:hypothetical protein [Planctomycetota bacterium]
MTRTQHGARIGALIVLAAGLLGWLSANTAIFFDDGLRYIGQAQGIARGSVKDGLLHAVDHPAYPAAIALSHALIGGETPQAWQTAAQAASALIGLMLIVPLYLVALELFGERAAWLGVALTFAVPLTGHILADVLSEGTFLLFWTWGLYAGLRFLREGRFAWLPLMILGGGLAYLSRPEGLLLPAAMVATLAFVPLMKSTRMNWPRWWTAVGFLVIGPALLVGPYVAAKGGIGTKPAVQRLLGTAPKSAPDAVERARPLDPNQSMARTTAEAVKAVFGAIRDAVTLPLLPLACFGLIVTVRRSMPERARVWLFLAIIAGVAFLALVRLHATGGYCSPRHAMVLAMILIPAAAAGLDGLLTSLPIPSRWLGLGNEEKLAAGPAVWMLLIGGFLAWVSPSLLEPINVSKAGYKDAGAWVARYVPGGAKVVDVTGLSLFYSGHDGYTFATLDQAPADPDLRWIVVRDNHLRGPWTYCKQLGSLVDGLKPSKTFPEKPRPGQARVYVFERPSRTAARTVAAPKG